MTSVQRPVSSVSCVSSVGRAFTLAAWHYQCGTSVHAQVGGVGIRGEQGAAFARCTKPRCPAWYPRQPHHTFAHSHSVTPAERCPPNTHAHTHTHRESLVAGCSSSSLSEVCTAEQWMFYPRETRNVSECCRLGLSPLSELALCALLPLGERGADTFQEEEEEGVAVRTKV